MATFNRNDSASESIKSPITKFLEWKWAKDGGYFSFYNKEEGANESFDLDEEFIVLRTGWSVKWYNERVKWIYSNEIERIGSEIIEVKGGNETLAKGLWKDIKDQVLALGAKLQRVITVLYKGEVIGIAVKGSALYELNTLLSTMSITKNKIEFKGADLRKKGAVEYQVPLFEIGSSITKDDAFVAQPFADKVSEYYNSKIKKHETSISEDDIDVEEKFGTDDNEDLPFN